MKSMLIVEDDVGYQELYALLLSEFRLTFRSNAEDALAELREKAFDLIITDITLLGISGLEFLKRLKPSGAADGIPVLVCSGQTDLELRRDALAGGAVDFIIKPFDGEALRRRVLELLGGVSRNSQDGAD